MKKPLIVISGPTASGKSSLAVELALRTGGEIVSADSMQVYRHMDIGTAKITEAEKKGVPHHMLDVEEPTRAFSIADYKEMALRCVRDIHSRGRLPIVAGGTGFYIRALLYDTEFGDAGSDPRLRARLEALLEEKGPEHLYGLLRERDPEAAESIHPNNRKRVLRALEYHMLTGERISEHNRRERARSSPYEFIYYALERSREELYPAIGRRVDKMLEDGLAEEVRALRAMGCTADMVSMQGLGYRQMFPYLDGQISLEEAAETIKLETRHYAKRQYTWLRREDGVTWLPAPRDEEDMEKLLERIVPEARRLAESCAGE